MSPIATYCDFDPHKALLVLSPDQLQVMPAQVVRPHRKPRQSLSAVELFAGCGGLALGLSKVGVHHQLLVEFNANAAKTIQLNQDRKVKFVRDWPLVQDDVRNVDWSKLQEKVRLVVGGPPCQPFSVGGRAAGHADSRDMWPEAIRAVRELEPDAFIFENVRGLLRPAFSEYVTWIKSFLGNPHLLNRGEAPQIEHLGRLGTQREQAYRVTIAPVNAADYGAPQKRHRVFFVGLRASVDVVLKPPTRTHSLERLVWDKWVTGEYWDRHGIATRKRPPRSLMEDRILKSLRSDLFQPREKAWVTCRDAFLGLGEPTKTDDGRNHRYQPGARSYAGHTGSPLDEPAKALKAGVHGVPGGENMLLLESGAVRYFTVREAARLQGLPDKFSFPGSWTESMRQIGNAVPTMLASAIATWVLSSAFPEVRLAA